MLTVIFDDFRDFIPLVVGPLIVEIRCRYVICPLSLLSEWEMMSKKTLKKLFAFFALVFLKDESEQWSVVSQLTTFLKRSWSGRRTSLYCVVIRWSVFVSRQVTRYDYYHYNFFYCVEGILSMSIQGQSVITKLWPMNNIFLLDFKSVDGCFSHSS